MLQLFTGNDFAGPGEQGDQNAKGLVLQLDAHAALTQFSGIDVDLKGSKLDDRIVLQGTHGCHSF